MYSHTSIMVSDGKPHVSSDSKLGKSPNLIAFGSVRPGTTYKQGVLLVLLATCFPFLSVGKPGGIEEKLSGST